MRLFERIWGGAGPVEEMEEEVRSHIGLRADDLERTGLGRAEAERRARIEFGGREKYREQMHEALGGVWWETLLGDVRLALRVLRKSPGFAVAAMLTLALAIGANAVVFGLLDGLILRPLGVPRPESLYGTHYGQNTGWQSYPNYADLRARNHSFEDLAAFNFALGVGLDTGNNPAVANAFATSGNYFDVLRVHPFLGRFFHEADEHGANSAPFVVLTHAYWHTHFHDDRGVVGRTVWLDRHPFTILGVAEPGFSGTLMFISTDFFVPLVNSEQLGGEKLTERGTEHAVFEVFGHLKPGVSRAEAEADVNAVGGYLEKAYPKDFGHKTTELGREGLTSFGSAVTEFVAALTVLAGLVLLAACANLGSLFSARSADRAREVALRLALGSSRRRILRQFLIEAGVIALGGGAVGLLGSIVLLGRLSVWHPFAGAPIHLPVEPDVKLYGVAALLAVVSGLLAGIVPVRQVLGANPYEIVKAGKSARVGRRVTVRDVLLVVQIAICGVLVTSSMVAVRGLVRSLHSNFGFEPRNSMTVGIDLAMGGYGIDRAPAVEKRMIEATASIPGVEHAGLVNGYPPLAYTAGNKVSVFRSDATDLRASNAAAEPFRYEISPGYLDAAGTTLLAGRDLRWQDDEKAPTVAVVNREFATKMFGSVTGALGRSYKLIDGTRVEVVGVVENGKYISLTEDQQAAMFLPYLKSPALGAYLVVRSGRDPQQLAGAIRAKLRTVDEALPVDTKSWNELLQVVLFPAQTATMALGVMGAIGAILSITGIFGLAAYLVSKRMRELGIRVALGAQRREVLRTALGRPLKLLGYGSAAGLVLGMLASRVLAFIVYQATPRDPLVLAGVVVAMALLGLAATWVPAQRALRVDPMMLLREE